MYRYVALLLCPLSLATVATAATAPVAYVYVSTSKGVNLYDVASTGKLTLVSGSPFKTTGLMIGSNGKYFITLGTDYVHSYLIASNGAIKQQESQINTQLYSGADCGTTAGAVFDHTGQYLYVSLNTSHKCDALQTVNIASANGLLTFKGSTSFDFEWPGTDAPPSITANGAFAYNQYLSDTFPHFIINSFTRESSGTLLYAGPPSEQDPTNAAGLGYTLSNLTPDPTNHLAAVVREADPSDSNTIGGIQQLASYTIGSQGKLTSTNPSAQMPTPKITVYTTNMAPSGKLLAVASAAYSSGDVPGLEVYHFNGAAPVTTYSGVLTTSPIQWIHWDNSNHLYALSASKLYVFTVTPTSITPASGSPYTIASPNGLFVVPK